MPPSVLTLNNPRSMKVNKLSDGTEYVFVPERTSGSILVVSFIGIWLLGWLVGEIIALYALFTGKGQSGGTVFLYVWLILWSLGGFVFFNIFLAFLVGKRIITIKNATLEIWDKYGLWQKKQSFPMSEVRNFRLDSEQQETSDSEPYTLHCVSADCGNKRVVLASSTKQEDLKPFWNELQVSDLSEKPVNEGSSVEDKDSGDDIYYADIPENNG